MEPKPNVWIVIPAYNEGEVIGRVLEELLESAKAWDSFETHVVVIDDCSKDSTANAVRKMPVCLCTHAVNLGQGAALQTGIDYALRRDADFIVMYDSDGQHTPESIPKLLAPLMRGEFDVALGTRFAEGAVVENISSSKRAVLQTAVLFTRITTGMKITDTHNGLRGLTQKAARSIRITQNRMAHASEILSEIARTELRYTEVPVRIRYTEYSVAKGQRIGNAVNILWDSFVGRILR